MNSKKPHWRTVDDIRGYVGDRIVAICQWREQQKHPVNYHVITLTIHEDGVIRDNEDLGCCLHDCERWMPEDEFLRLFGPESPPDAPPDATPWQQADTPPAQNDCIRLYVVCGADGRNYYGKTLEEAQQLAADGKYQLAEFAPGSGVPWQQADGWEGRQ